MEQSKHNEQWQTLQFELSCPYTTINGAYDNARIGRVKTAKYKKWLNDAAVEWIQQRNQMIIAGVPIVCFACPVGVLYEVTDKVSIKHRPKNKARDLGNHEKMLGDFMVNNGILKDDRFISQIIMRWSDEVAGVRITVKPYD